MDRVVCVVAIGAGVAAREGIAIEVEPFVGLSIGIVVEPVACLRVDAVHPAVGIDIGKALVRRAVAVVVEPVAVLGVEAVLATVGVRVAEPFVDDGVAVVVAIVAELGRAWESERIGVVAVTVVRCEPVAVGIGLGRIIA